MEKLLLLYMFINTFLTGMYYENGFCWVSETKRMRVAYVAMFIFLFFFGVSLQIFLWLWEGGRWIVVQFTGLTQIRSYWKYFLLGGWRTIPLEELKRMNDIVEGHKKRFKLSLKDRHFIYVLNLINQKREYIHERTDQGTESQN